MRGQLGKWAKHQQDNAATARGNTELGCDHQQRFHTGRNNNIIGFVRDLDVGFMLRRRQLWQRRNLHDA